MAYIRTGREFALVAILLVTLSGCGSGSGNIPVNHSLVGTWKDVSVSANGTTQACPGSFVASGQTITCGVNDTVTFTNSGTWSQTTDTGTQTGRYFYFADTGVLEIALPVTGATLKFTVHMAPDGSNFTLDGAVNAVVLETDRYVRQ